MILYTLPKVEPKYSQQRVGLWSSYLDFKFVWDARSLDEYFCEGPKIRVPPCSLPPLAGAHVGRAAVVMLAHNYLNYLEHQYKMLQNPSQSINPHSLHPYIRTHHTHHLLGWLADMSNKKINAANHEIHSSVQETKNKSSNYTTVWMLQKHVLLHLEQHATKYFAWLSHTYVQQKHPMFTKSTIKNTNYKCFKIHFKQRPIIIRKLFN